LASKGGDRLIRPSLDKLLLHADSRYTLVTAAAKRARKILEDDQPNEERSIKAVTIALEEINAGRVTIERNKNGIK
jgi:DNA-directed RNA polymerase subunit omega